MKIPIPKARGRGYRFVSKRAKKIMKKYSTRRAAIKRGETGSKAQFGRAGHSSWWD